MIEQAIMPTYKAVLRGNRLEWHGDVRRHIPADRAVTVYVTLVDESPVDAEGTAEKQGAAMAAALTRLAEIQALADIRDAAAWEQEMRQDRELPGRSA